MTDSIHLISWDYGTRVALWELTGKSIHEKYAIQHMISAVSFFADASPRDIVESDVYLDSVISGVPEQKLHSSHPSLGHVNSGFG